MMIPKGQDIAMRTNPKTRLGALRGRGGDVGGGGGRRKSSAIGAGGQKFFPSLTMCTSSTVMLLSAPLCRRCSPWA